MTRRTVMLPATDRDLPALVDFWNDPGVRELAFEGEAVAAEQAARLLDAGRAASTRGLGWWLVHPWSRAPALGCVGLLPSPVAARAFDPPGEAVGVLIAFPAEAWAQGYAHEAMTELVRHALEGLHLPHLSLLGPAPDPMLEGLLQNLDFTLRLEADTGSRRVRLYGRCGASPMPARVEADRELVASLQEPEGGREETARSRHPSALALLQTAGSHP